MFSTMRAAPKNTAKRRRKDGRRVKHFLRLRELLADPDVELIVNLTPPRFHAELNLRILQAGKHLFSEKPFALTVPEAKEILRTAEKNGLSVGSAPDTFLGTCFQTARRAIEEGLIGEIHSFSIAISRNNDLGTALFPFLRLPGAGCLRDYMVYYITALISLLGPAKRASAFVKTPYPRRRNTVPGTDGFGEIIPTPNESIVTAILELKNGIVGTIHENNETILADRADFAIYGTNGILLLGNPNQFGDPVRLLRAKPGASLETETLEPVSGYGGNARGLGAADLVEALRSGRPNSASKEMAAHVLEILEAIELSGQSGQAKEITSSCVRPLPFPV